MTDDNEEFFLLLEKAVILHRRNSLYFSSGKYVLHIYKQKEYTISKKFRVTKSLHEAYAYATSNQLTLMDKTTHTGLRDYIVVGYESSTGIKYEAPAHSTVVFMGAYKKLSKLFLHPQAFRHRYSHEQNSDDY